MEINFVTRNKGKVKEFQEILKGTDIKLVHTMMEYPEIQSDDPIEITKQAAKLVAEKLQKTVVVEDSGLYIEALNGFPGAFSATIYDQIGLKGLIKIMQGVGNRTCHYKSAAGYCEPGKEPLGFLGEEKGAIAQNVSGTNGFGHDPIFIPEGSDKTYGEMDNPEAMKKFRRRALLELIDYLKSRK